ncbi:AI-2E family transporter [Amycolatopsis viridis]|uniref:PurR-regulated permease PerM n=1 Tax=Amycolatopsis viridis TaxID=185678 RepID=A0ABX0SMD4_9PSEU|nr:AI-2E family transporter [Amycolatopsis viridis]NIH77698.1 putative PurR-regulated permease PerM [Amycolatopsis viridis]
MSEPQPPKYGFLSDDSVVPRGLRVSAAFGWRFLVVAAAAYLILRLLAYLSVVVIPVAIALLLAALLAPAVARLVRVKVPRGLATAIVLIGGLAVLGGLLTFVITQVTDGLPALTSQVNNSLNQIKNFLINDLHLKQEQIQQFIDNSISFLQHNQAAFTNSALTTATTVGEILTGFVLTLFVTIFFLAGGDRIWDWLMLGIPSRVRQRVDVAGRRGFASLVAFVRATAAVAVVDAVGVGIGLAILGVPLAIPLSTLVFLGAFIPIFGAVITGAVAVLVALVTKGFVTALIVLAILIAVMQLESHILQPLLLGRAVKLHPLAVVLGIAAGLVVYGIPGALLAVPLMSIINAGVRSLLHEVDPNPAEVDVLHDIEAVPNADANRDDEEPGAADKP